MTAKMNLELLTREALKTNHLYNISSLKNTINDDLRLDSQEVKNSKLTLSRNLEMELFFPSSIEREKIIALR